MEVIALKVPNYKAHIPSIMGQMRLLIFSKTTFVKIMQRPFFQEKFLLSSFLESSQRAEEQDERRRNDILQDEVLVSGYQARRLDPMLPKNGNK